MEPKVTLLSHTQNPIKTLYTVWQASKGNAPVPPLMSVNRRDPKVLEVFQKVVEAKIPVAEHLDFVFLLENVSVSLREQIVRHRIGVKVDARVGVDTVPDLADSSWWSQSMRILDMGKFADEEAYRLPESLKGKFVDIGTESFPQMISAESAYRTAMQWAQDCYKQLVRAGIPAEDARDVLPLATTHRMTWKLNLAALQHIIGKRGCWILQLGLWKPIITGMVNELAEKVHPLFRNLINPPCISGDKFKRCAFAIDNERRYTGEDNLPPCSLWFAQEAPKRMDFNAEKITQIHSDPEFNRMKGEYRQLWERNPETGDREALAVDPGLEEPEPSSRPAWE